MPAVRKETRSIALSAPGVCHELIGFGTDLRDNRELLSHNTSCTTEIYTHISQYDFQSIRRPFDSL
jgi:site-specific recombinase XerD